MALYVPPFWKSCLETVIGFSFVALLVCLAALGWWVMFARMFTTLGDLRLVCLVSVLSWVFMDVRDMLSVRGDQLLIWVELGSYAHEVVIASLIHVWLSCDGLNGGGKWVSVWLCWYAYCGPAMLVTRVTSPCLCALVEDIVFE